MAGEFPYGVEFQKTLLSLMLHDGAVASLGVKYLKPTYFEVPQLGWVFERIKDHMDAYDRPPTAVVLEEAIRMSGDQAADLWAAAATVIQTPPAEPEFIAERLVDFVQRNVFAVGFGSARALYNNGQADEAYEVMMRHLEEVQGIGIGDLDRSFFFEDLEERLTARRLREVASFSDTFATGIPEIDKVLDGGLSVGELGTWIAYAKIGKTAMLRWLAFRAVRAQRVPVYVAILEGSRSGWEGMMDAAFGDVLFLAAKRGNIGFDAHMRMVSEFAELKRLMVFRGFTKGDEAWDVTIANIVADLKDLRNRKGFIPKMVVIDYADLLKTRVRADSDYQAGKMIYQDLIVLANQGYAVWTACQAQRPKDGADEREHIIKGKDVSDSYHKIRLATFYGSLNRTLEEKAAHQMRIYAEEYRENEAGVLVHVETDQAHGRLIRSVLAPPDENAPVTGDIQYGNA